MFNSSKRLVFAILTMLVAGSCTLYYAVAVTTQSHMTGTACATCHLAGSGVTTDNSSMLVASQEFLCARCHPKATQVSHPSGFRPTGVIPASFPLDWKGDLTCSTCHEVHGSTPGFLRTAKRGQDFCMSCHDAKFFDKMADQGSSMVISGHLSTSNIDLRSAGIDVYSLQCMGCHGRQGDANAVSVDSNLVMRHVGNSVNHPIGARYSEAVSYGGYRPQIMLNKKILLPDGKISCVSCHLGYTKDHGKLVIPKDRSSICFECHDL